MMETTIRFLLTSFARRLAASKRAGLTAVSVTSCLVATAVPMWADVPAGFAHSVSVAVRLQTNEPYRQRLPRARAQPLPEYPTRMREERVQGEATIEVSVARDGSTRSVRVLRNTDELFGNAASLGAKKWVFSPATDEAGQPREMILVFIVTFSIHE
jgi:TonB family protein